MSVYIKAISYHLPSTVLTNDELAQRFDCWRPDRALRKLGIESRHLVSDDGGVTEMAQRAVRSLFDEYSLSPSSVDFILVCTQSPEGPLTSVACALQRVLGLPNSVGALDFNMGCSGWIYGLGLAKGLLASNIASNVLLVTTEAYSLYIDSADRSNLSLFGDAATATMVSSTGGFAEIGGFEYGTDGSGAGFLTVRCGMEASQSVRQGSLYMDGPEVFEFAIERVPPLLARVIDANGLSFEDIGLYVLHQANRFMLENIGAVAGIPSEKLYIDLLDTGNTVSNSIPIALKRAICKGLAVKGMNIALAGFGVGFSWGATVIKMC